MTDSIDSVLHPKGHEDCIEIYFQAFKQQCLDQDTLNVEKMHARHVLAKKLFSSIQAKEHTTPYPLSNFLSFLSSSSKLQETTLNNTPKGASSTQLIKTTSYVMLNQNINQQLNALKVSIENLLKNDLPLCNSTFNTRAYIPLLIIKEIAHQIKWVETYLIFFQNIHTSRKKIPIEIQAEKNRIEILHQIKKLFHAVYAKSINYLITSILDKLKKPITEIQSANITEIIADITYIQSYAELCLMPDLTLHANILNFNQQVLYCLSPKYPTSPIVLRAQQSILNTGASIDNTTYYKTS